MLAIINSHNSHLKITGYGGKHTRGTFVLNISALKGIYLSTFFPMFDRFVSRA